MLREDEFISNQKYKTKPNKINWKTVVVMYKILRT